ncbi:hypothetical protein [Stappia sp.]|uniref:hypothetical protein n=1 Tax=Stappia sp. TaxID=1870903 RepID=UPI0032D97B82
MTTRKLILSAALALLMSAPVAVAAPGGAAPAAAKPAVAGTLVQDGQVHLAGKRWRGHRGQRLGPRRIVRKLHRRGFTNIQRIRPRGDVYIVRANGRRGAPLRLVVDAYSGQIVGRTVVRGPWQRPHRGGQWGHHWGGNGVGFGVWGRW